jgi:hypothetical protein
MSVPLRRIHTEIPSEVSLSKIPLARAGEFHLSENETKQTRRLVYALNKQGNFRYRTMWDGEALLVWRIR